jgi:glutamate-1-semialdehyde 2,1-aminomutase
VAVAAGRATLELVQAPGFFDRLAATGASLVDGLSRAAQASGVKFSAQSIGGMFGVYFAQRSPQSYTEVMACDRAAFNRFFHAMLEQGVYLAPSAFEAGFVSAAHTAADLEQTVGAARRVFERMTAPG